MTCNNNPENVIGVGRAKKYKRAFRRAFRNMLREGAQQCLTGGYGCTNGSVCGFKVSSVDFIHQVETTADGVVHSVTASGLGECECMPT